MKSLILKIIMDAFIYCLVWLINDILTLLFNDVFIGFILALGDLHTGMHISLKIKMFHCFHCVYFWSDIILEQ